MKMNLYRVVMKQWCHVVSPMTVTVLRKCHVPCPCLSVATTIVGFVFLVAFLAIFSSVSFFASMFPWWFWVLVPWNHHCYHCHHHCQHCRYLYDCLTMMMKMVKEMMRKGDCHCCCCCCSSMRKCGDTARKAWNRSASSGGWSFLFCLRWMSIGVVGPDAFVSAEMAIFCLFVWLDCVLCSLVRVMFVHWSLSGKQQSKGPLMKLLFLPNYSEKQAYKASQT